jgi:hypothetical protein
VILPRVAVLVRDLFRVVIFVPLDTQSNRRPAINWGHAGDFWAIQASTTSGDPVQGPDGARAAVTVDKESQMIDGG